MEPLDNEFFEKYKSLERLCSDMYSCKNGVSLYIEDMESRSPQRNKLNFLLGHGLQTVKASALDKKSDRT